MAEYTLNARVRHARKPEATWTSENPVLLQDEIGFVKETGRFKIGDGTTAWNSLSYATVDPIAHSAALITSGTLSSNRLPTVPVSKGGTGVTSLTSGQALIGNGTGAVTTRAITNITAKGALVWTSDIGGNLVNLNTLAYWNGAYSGTSSNLSYCNRGAFGTIVTKAAGDYLAVGGTAAAAKKLVANAMISTYSNIVPSDYIADGGVVGLHNSNASDSNGYPAASSSGAILFGKTNAGVLMAARAGQTIPTIYVRQYYQSWGDWALLLHSSNYTSYTVKKDGTGASGTWGISITGNAKTATSAGKWTTARTLTLTGSVTGSASIDGSGNVSLATTTNHNHDTRYVYDKANVSGTMNDAATYRNAMGMINVSAPTSGTASYVNPNGQTGWHHFINMSYSETNSSNMWQTQIANKAGTTDLWVRSRAGGAVSDSAAWAAPWTRILTGSNYTNLAVSLNTAQTISANKTMNAILYFANGTTYYVNNSGVAKFNTVTATTFTGALSGNASSATTAYTGRHLPIAFYGSATAGTAGWYKVGTFSQSGNSDYNLNLLITSGYSRQAQGLLHIHTRCNNSTTIGIQTIKWMYRYGFEVGHAYAKDNGNNTWSLYVYQSNNQHGRVQVQILTQTGTATSQYDLTLTSNGTPETSAPTGGTAATDGGISNQANTLATARTINGTSFNGSANITTANWGTARTLTIGNTGKSVNGAGNVSWSLSEIGALPTAGGTMSGDISFATIASWPTVSGETYPIESKGLYWSGSSDLVKLFYRVVSSDGGKFIIQLGDSTDEEVIVENTAGTVYAKIGNGGVTANNFYGNATSATYLKDKNNGTATYLNYGAAGITSPSWFAAWNGYELRAISPTETRKGISALAAVNKNSHYGMAAPDGTDTVWIRTTNQGIIPFAAAAAGKGTCYLGTSSWYFGTAYIDNVYGTTFHGNATTATSAGKWSTARKITLTGSVTGSVSIDGSGDVSLATTTNHTHGLLHSSFAKQIANTTTDSGWSMINDTYSGYILMSLRTQANAPAWIQNNYAAGIAFGGADTKGVLSMAYGSPKITFAGGNGSKPVWYFSLNATSGKTYTFSASGGTVLDSSNYSTNITSLTKGLTVFNGNLTPLTIKGGVSGNLESSISYTHPEVSSSNNWVVGMGTGGTGYGYFGFWNNAYGNVMRLSNNGSAYVSNSIYFGWQVSSNDGKARLFSDSEGGNISLVSPNNIEYQIDTVNDIFRIYRRPTDGSSYVSVLETQNSSGHIYNAGSKVICARNFTLSGNTLYITTT